MNKLTLKMKSLVAGLVLVIATAIIGFLATNTNAIPYIGENTPPSPVPAFNVYTGVPDVGDESEFLYGKRADSSADSVKNVVSTCETGTRFALRAYVHNGASEYENGNGDGPSVAKDTKIKVTLPTGEATEFKPSATISASNAASISDDMTIRCSDGRTVKVKYVAGSAQQYNPISGIQPVSDSIVTTGAPIGTMAPNGDLWGCFEQRVWVRLVVEVEEVEVPELLPAVCELLEVVALSGKKVRIDDVRYKANDATVNNVTVDFGDGNKKVITDTQTELPYTHTYASAGNYNIVATVNTTFEGKAQAVTSDNCKDKVEIEEEAKPVYACEDFKLSLNGRKATATFKVVAENGATFKHATVVFSADGNKKETITTDKVNNGVVTTNYTFTETDERVSANATVSFNVNNEVKSVECGDSAVLGTTVEKCEIPGLTNLDKDDPACKITDTGAGSIAGVLAAVTAAGTALHRKFTLSRQ